MQMWIRKQHLDFKKHLEIGILNIHQALAWIYIETWIMFCMYASNLDFKLDSGVRLCI